MSAHNDIPELINRTHAVNENADEGRIEAVLRSKCRNRCIRHALRHKDNSDSDTGDEVTSEPAEI